MSALLTPSNLIDRPIEDGDCGVILRKDGSFQIFSTGVINPNEMTGRQEEQGALLIAIAVCLNLPELKKNMLKLASDPGILAQLEKSPTSH